MKGKKITLNISVEVGLASLRAYNVYKAESFFVNEKLFAVKLPPF
jgi:hypothetical protein